MEDKVWGGKNWADVQISTAKRFFFFFWPLESFEGVYKRRRRGGGREVWAIKFFERANQIY